MVKAAQDEDIRNARSDFTPCQRYIGDSRCWTIPILPMLELLGDSMATNTWELKYQPIPIVELEFEALAELQEVLTNPDVNTKGRVEPVLNFTILRSENLRFSYLVVDKSVQEFLTPALLQSSEGGR